MRESIGRRRELRRRGGEEGHPGGEERVVDGEADGGIQWDREGELGTRRM